MSDDPGRPLVLDANSAQRTLRENIKLLSEKRARDEWKNGCLCFHPWTPEQTSSAWMSISTPKEQCPVAGCREGCLKNARTHSSARLL